MTLRRLSLWMWALVLAVGLGACAEDSARLQPPAAAVAATQAGAAASGSPAAPDYVIGPGDELSIFVYRAPELSISLPVRPDGKISLPLIDDLEAAGKTSTRLARDIEEKLKNYLREPTVTVMVRGFVGPAVRQIRVIGEATQPMAMPFREGMTMLDVMIGVRGLTRYAAGNRAELIRREREGAPPETIRVRLSDLLRDGDISQDIPMRPGDTLIIPQGWF